MKVENELENLNSNGTGFLWNKLSDEQKQQLLSAYEESFDKENLITHEEVIKSHEKWLML